MSLNSTMPVSSHTPSPAATARCIRYSATASLRSLSIWPAGSVASAVGGAARFGRGIVVGSSRRARASVLRHAARVRSTPAISAGMPSSSASSSSSPRRSPESGPTRASRRVGEGEHDRDVVALGLGRRRVVVPGLVFGLRFDRLARQPVGAVEHERRVPGAAVGRADRVGTVVGREQQRRSQPRERDHDVHRARGQQLQQAPLRGDPRHPQVGEHREAAAARRSTRAASRRRRSRARPRPPAARRSSRSRSRARSGTARARSAPSSRRPSCRCAR